MLQGVTAEAHSGTVAEVVGSGGLAIAIIGLATLVGSVPGAAGRGIRFVLFPVAAAGGMALTLYTAQALALTIVREANRIDAERWAYPEATLPVLIVVRPGDRNALAPVPRRRAARAPAALADIRADAAPRRSSRGF